MKKQQRASLLARLAQKLMPYLLPLIAAEIKRQLDGAEKPPAPRRYIGE